MDDVPVQHETTITSVHNFRCVLRSKKLYRSARQDNITEEDCKVLEELNVKTILDLRSLQEYKHAYGDKLFDQGCEVHSVTSRKQQGQRESVLPVATDLILQPKNARFSECSTRRRIMMNYIGSHMLAPMLWRLSILQNVKLFLLVGVDFIFGSKYSSQYFAKTLINPAGLASTYKDLLDLSGKQIANSKLNRGTHFMVKDLCKGLLLLSEPQLLPAIVNCAIGKDRTGLLIALVLSVLGHSDDYIAQDYALSEEGLQKIRGKVLQGISSGYNWSMDESFADAKQETMVEVLNYLRTKYGSIPSYLESIGFDLKSQEKLKKSLSAD